MKGTYRDLNTHLVAAMEAIRKAREINELTDAIPGFDIQPYFTGLRVANNHLQRSLWYLERRGAFAVGEEKPAKKDEGKPSQAKESKTSDRSLPTPHAPQ